MLLVIHFQRRDVRNADSVVEIKANNATDAGKSQYRNSQRLRERIERPELYQKLVRLWAAAVHPFFALSSPRVCVLKLFIFRKFHGSMN
jgi:hypothetical protein